MMEIKIKLFRKNDESVLKNYQGQEYLPQHSSQFLKETSYLKVYYASKSMVICEMMKGDILNTHTLNYGDSAITVLRIHRKIYNEHENIKFLVNPLNKRSVRSCNKLMKILGYKRAETKDYFYLYSK